MSRGIKYLYRQYQKDTNSKIYNKMRKTNFLVVLITLFVIGCSKEVEIPNGGDDSGTKSISVALSNSNSLTVGKEAMFIVKNDAKKDITSSSKIFVNKEEIKNGKYTPKKAGKVEVYATYKSFSSSIINLEVKEAVVVSPGTGGTPSDTKVTPKDSYTPKVLIHDFTGTWCGYCASAYYEIKELHEKFPKNVISVGVHRGSGPNDDGSFDYERYSDFKVKGNPVLWFNYKPTEDAPLYGLTVGATYVKSPFGLAINYDLKNNSVIVNVHSKKLSDSNKLVIYLVEDKLIANQVNYGHNRKDSPAYQKGNPILDLEHNNVLRKIITNFSGDVIPKEKIKNGLYTVKYSLEGKKDNVKNIQNTKIIAFVLDSNGKALNTQVAKVNENKNFD